MPRPGCCPVTISHCQQAGLFVVLLPMGNCSRPRWCWGCPGAWEGALDRWPWCILSARLARVSRNFGKVRARHTVQAIAVELWEVDVRLYLIDGRGLEQPQPRSRGILRNKVQVLSQLGFDCAYVVGSIPVSRSRGGGGGGAGD